MHFFRGFCLFVNEGLRETCGIVEEEEEGEVKCQRGLTDKCR